VTSSQPEPRDPHPPKADTHPRPVERKAEASEAAGGEQAYVHALRFSWLTRFYDTVLRFTLPERAMKARLCEEALEGLEPGGRVLDLGCGTGTLTLMVKERCPQAQVVGVDGDPEVLDIARRKARAAGLEVEFLQGDATDLVSLGQSRFDRVMSSLVLHHLNTESKRRALRGARGLLIDGGQLHLLDWGKAQNLLMRLAFVPVQLLDGFSTTSDNVKGLLPAIIEEAGFEDVAETGKRMTIFGSLSLYRGRSAGVGGVGRLP